MEPAADGGAGHIASYIFQCLAQGIDCPHQLGAAAAFGDLPGKLSRSGTAGAAGQGLLQKAQPAFQQFGKGIPLPFFQGDQHLGQSQGIPGGKGLHKTLGLGWNRAALGEDLLRLPIEAAAAVHGGGDILFAWLGEIQAQLPVQQLFRQGHQLQLGAAGAHRGQQLFGIVRQKDKYTVLRRLLQDLQQGILALGAQLLGEEVDLVGGFVGPDEHILPDLPDDLHRHILMLRILHGDEVRVVSRFDLPAGAADTAGLAAALAENGLGQKLCQRVLAGAFGAGDQIEVGDMAPVKAGCQGFLQPVVAQ